MAGVRFSGLVAAAVAGSMFVTSTGAIAAAAPAASARPVSDWAALSVLSSGAPAATLCGGAAAGCGMAATGTAVAQDEQNAAPPPAAAPAMAAPATAYGSPLIFVLGALVVGTLVYFLVRNHHRSISPA